MTRLKARLGYVFHSGDLSEEIYQPNQKDLINLYKKLF